MEDGPYRNTRSSAGSSSKTSEKINNLKEPCDKVNEKSTPLSNISAKERVRTLSGHLISNSVGDIRNFFDRKDNSPFATPLNHKTSSAGKNSQLQSQLQVQKSVKHKGVGSSQPITSEKQRAKLLQGQQQLNFDVVADTIEPKIVSAKDNVSLDNNIQVQLSDHDILRSLRSQMEEAHLQTGKE